MNRDPKTTRAAIRELCAHLSELHEIDPEKEGRAPGRTEARAAIDRLQGKINRTLARAFGIGSPEYEKHAIEPFVHQPRKRATYPHQEFCNALRDYRQGIEFKIEDALALLNEEVQGLEGLDLHPHIEAAAGQLFKDGHYADAVEAACKMLKTLVQNYSGRRDLDGERLMSGVFSLKSPILAFSDLETDTEKSEQLGMMHLFAGVMCAFRNPRSHGFVQDDPGEASNLIWFISFLAKQLDRAMKV